MAEVVGHGQGFCCKVVKGRGGCRERRTADGCVQYAQSQDFEEEGQGMGVSVVRVLFRFMGQNGRSE